MTLPDISELKKLLKYPPISLEPPLFKVPKYSTPAISDPKRTQRVQEIHRVIIVFISGPQYLSSIVVLLKK